MNVQQQMQMLQMQQQALAGAAAGAGAGAGGEVGQAKVVRIQGCTHDVVGPIIRGDYQLAQMNHGKPAYKKDGGANQATTVMIYYWDERDGVSASGWWIGPQIGGNMVWGHHTNRTSATPPTSGWQAPHSAPADPTMSLVPLAEGAAPQVAAVQPAQQLQQAQLLQQQQMLQLRQQQMQQLQQQQQAQQQQGQAAQKAQWEAKMAQHRVAQQQSQQDQAAQRKQQMEQMKVEQTAIMSLRKVLMKLKTTTPETFQEIMMEINTLATTELAKCGSQAVNIKTECEKALLAAKERIDQVLELRRKNEEKQQEIVRQREEARQASLKLLNELKDMVDEAETEQKTLLETIKELSERKDITTEAAVDRAMSKVQTESESALEKVNAALEFFRTKQNDMKLLPPIAKKAPEKKDGEAAEEPAKEPEPPNMMLLSRRAFATKGVMDREISGLKVLKVKFMRRAEAHDLVKKQKAVFDKYDKNKDKMLCKKEITALAKGEYKFQLPEEDMAQVDAVLIAGKAKGVKFEDFSRLLTAVGVAREKAKDTKRREARLEREEELAEEKKKIQALIEEVQEVVKDASTFLTELLDQTRTLPKDMKDKTAVEMLERAVELEEQATSGEEKLKVAQEKAEEFGKDGVDKDLEQYVKGEKTRLSMQAKNLDGLSTSAKTAVDNFKAQATKKDEAEVSAIGEKALARLRAYQIAEKLSPADVFKKIAGGSESFDKDEFVAFMAKAPKADEKDDEEISEDSFGRAFTVFDEDKAGAVSAETLGGLLWRVMKVVRDVALTPACSIEDTTLVRRLEVGEAVEVLEGPVEEGELKRIKAKCLQDDVEGWLSVSGNQGTIFLKDGGNDFKVVKETILTEFFEIEKASTKKTSTRKLKIGELLQARTSGKKQEESGLTRMKVKAKQDGLVGWVTTLGNTGVKFVEMA